MTQCSIPCYAVQEVVSDVRLDVMTRLQVTEVQDVFTDVKSDDPSLQVDASSTVVIRCQLDARKLAVERTNMFLTRRWKL